MQQHGHGDDSERIEDMQSPVAEFVPFEKISDADLTEMFAAYVAAVNARGGYVFPRDEAIAELCRMSDWLKAYEQRNGTGC